MLSENVKIVLFEVDGCKLNIMYVLSDKPVLFGDLLQILQILLLHWDFFLY